MEDVANPFKSIAPTNPIPVELDHIILANMVPLDTSKIKIVTTN